MSDKESWVKVIQFTAYLISAIALVFILKTLKGIFIPLVLSIFFAYLFAPIVEFLAKFKIPRIATLFVLLGIISLIGIFGSQIISKNIKEFIKLWPTYESTIISSITSFFEQYLNIETKNFFEILRSARVTELLSSLVNKSLNIFGKILSTLLILIFIYLSYHNYPALIKKAFPEDKSKRIFNIINNINEQIINYILIKTVISAGTGLLTGVSCAVLGIQFAVLWGFLAFLLNYIPYIGSIVAVILPIALSFIQFPHSFLPFLSAIILIVIQLFMGSFLDPEMMGNKFNLSPVVIVISLFFWGYVWGAVGTFLAVPMTALLKIVFQNIDSLHFLSILMSKKAD